MTDTKKTRTPRTVESIIKGALALPLQERVGLMKELKLSIDAEVKELTEKAKIAASIANGS